ncbi:MAG: hypothetical protein LBQ32_05870 [Burkholderiaceae bacterium]|jgi:hypothetical protein|nr:hypothetical protein [Burkholderiaceae bacterium]
MPFLLLLIALIASSLPPAGWAQEPSIEEPTPEPALADAPSTPLPPWNFHSRRTLIGYLTQQSVEIDGPYNPGNQLARIPKQLANFEWREDLRLNIGSCDAGTDFRLVGQRVLRADADTDRQWQHQAYARTGSIGCRFGDGFEARLGREVLQWGNATFRSPSNPFFIDTGKTDPIRELFGKDFLQFSWRSESGLKLSALHHFGNASRDNTAMGAFRPTTAVRIEQTDPTQNAGIIVSARRGDGMRVGSYLTRTLSDAWLAYADISLQRGSDGLYPVADAQAPSGWRMAKRTSDSLYATTLLGAAYTFESGWTLTGELLYDPRGYNAVERRQAQSAALAGSALFGTESQPSGAALLGSLQQPQLMAIGQRYVFLQLLRSDWHNRADVAVRLSHNVDDGSSQLSGSLTWFLNDSTQLLWLVAFNHGPNSAEFSRNVRWSNLLGLRFTL